MAEPGELKASTFSEVPRLRPLLLAVLLARTGAMMVGLAMGSVAYEQATSAFTVALVAAAFGLAFALSALVAGQIMQRVGLRTMLAGALALQVAGTLVLAETPGRPTLPPPPARHRRNVAGRPDRPGLLREVPRFGPLLLGALLAKTGATMVGLAMGFVAYQQTGSALAVSIVVSSFGVTFALSSLIAGHVLQRVGLRAMLVGALAAQVAGALALATVTNTEGADVTWLTVCGLGSGAASALIFLGSQMLIHGLAPGEYLERAVSLDAAASSLSRIAGPALGGILLAQIGIPLVFVIAAVGYVPFALVLAVVAAPIAVPRSEERPKLRQAARLFRRRPILRWALITAALAETLALPLVIMLPAVTAALDRDDADRLGVLVACVAVGSIAQLAVLARLRTRLDARLLIGLAYGAAGALLLALALGQNVFLVGAILIVFGLSVSIGRTLLMTCVHVGAPDTHRHHVLSLYLFLTAAATPIGALIWGTSADVVGIDATIAASGVVLLLGVGVALISILRRADVPASVAPTAAAAPAAD